MIWQKIKELKVYITTFRASEMVVVKYVLDARTGIIYHVNSSQCYASVCSITMMASLGCHVIPALLALTYACDGQISSRHHLLAKNLFSTYCSR